MKILQPIGVHFARSHAEPSKSGNENKNSDDSVNQVIKHRVIYDRMRGGEEQAELNTLPHRGPIRRIVNRTTKKERSDEETAYRQCDRVFDDFHGWFCNSGRYHDNYRNGQSIVHRPRRHPNAGNRRHDLNYQSDPDPWRSD
jgi:hypothetical protein